MNFVARLYSMFCIVQSIKCQDGNLDVTSKTPFERILSVNKASNTRTAIGVPKRGFFEGDIVLSAKSDIFPNRAVSKLQFGSTSDINLLWPRKTIPYILADDIKYERGHATYNAIKLAFEEYKNKTCIKFKERTDERDYIKLFKGAGCWSLVGRNGGMQEVSIGAGCEQKGVVTHELMHALGFWHEQSRPDRDKYIQIVEANVIDGFENQFKKYDRGEIDSRGSPYDYGSVMHYGATAFTKNGQVTVRIIDSRIKIKLGQRNGLSILDAKQINDLYKCKTDPVNGNWGPWSPLSACSTLCGRGKQSRFRECNNPVPRNGGDHCPGLSMEDKDCFVKECSVDCNFDKDLCLWKDSFDDDFDWKRGSGGTPSGSTGPDNDHTHGNSAGSYLFIEVSSPRMQGDKARLESFTIAESTKDRCFSFWYNMNGATIGSLEVLLVSPVQSKRVWALSGMQGAMWKEGRLQVPGRSGNFKIAIIGTRGLDFRGDIAIDDTRLEDGKCDVLPNKPTTVKPGTTTTMPTRAPKPSPQAVGFNCNFESGKCGWTDTDMRDYIDWRRWKGKTLSSMTGPDVDHTRGSSEGYYIYIEASTPQVSGDNAQLLSPTLSVNAATKPKCFSFFYFMYGESVNQLKVSVLLKNGKESLQWALKGPQGKMWLPAKMPLPTGTSYKIVIEGVVGESYLSDIAVDDLLLADGACPITPPSAAPKRIVPTTASTKTGSSIDMSVEVEGQACTDPKAILKDSVLSGITPAGSSLGRRPGGAKIGFHRADWGLRSSRRDKGQGRGAGRGKAKERKMGHVHGSKDFSSTISDTDNKRPLDATGLCSAARSSIKINGVEYSKQQQGHNVVAVNARNGKVYSRAYFATNVDILAGYSLKQYISNLPAYTVFAIATQGRADYSHLLSSDSYFPPRGGSLAIIAYKGTQKIEWIRRVVKKGGQGPSRLNAGVNLVHTTKTTRKIVLLNKDTFSGRTFLPIPSRYSALLNFGLTDFTIMAWIRTSKDGTIISKTGKSKQYQPEIRAIYIEGGKVTVRLGRQLLMSASTSVNDMRWHHVALLAYGQMKPTRAVLYIDGTKEVEKTYVPSADPTDYNVKIGYTVELFPSVSAFTGDLRNVFYFDAIVDISVLKEALTKVPF